MEPTGFCWSCGLAYDLERYQKLFCSLRCQKHYEREQRAEANRVIRKGKRAGYGPQGSTH